MSRSSLRLVTLNLWNGGRLLSEAVRFLGEVDADIYALQEAYDGHERGVEERYRTVEILRAAFPGYSLSFAPVYFDTSAPGRPTEDGQLVMSRFPITSQRSVFLDVGYSSYDQNATRDFTNFPVMTQFVAIDTPLGALTIGNVHGPVNLNGDELSERRVRFVRQLLEIKERPTILLGDFNARPTNPMFRELEGQYQNVFGNELITTFNLKRKDLQRFPGYAQSAVDAMFVSRDLNVVGKKCYDMDVSDHLPLEVSIQRNIV